MKYKVLFLVFIFISVACKTTSTLTEVNHLKETVSSKQFELNLDTAYPIGLANVIGLERLMPPGSNTSSINLINNPNHFIVKNDSLSIDLPYYGEQQFPRSYNPDGGIKMNGRHKELSSKFEAKKQRFVVNYLINDSNESLRATLILYPNFSCNLSINSSHRTTIRYVGHWKALE